MLELSISLPFKSALCQKTMAPVTAVNCYSLMCVISTMNIHYDQIRGSQKGAVQSYDQKMASYNGKPDSCYQD